MGCLVLDLVVVAEDFLREARVAILVSLLGRPQEGWRRRGP
jgi:hypothetical protein